MTPQTTSDLIRHCRALMNLFGIHSHDHFLIYLSRSLSLSLSHTPDTHTGQHTHRHADEIPAGSHPLISTCRCLSIPQCSLLSVSPSISLWLGRVLLSHQSLLCVGSGTPC